MCMHQNVYKITKRSRTIHRISSCSHSHSQTDHHAGWTGLSLFSFSQNILLVFVLYICLIFIARLQKTVLLLTLTNRKLTTHFITNKLSNR